MVTGVMAQKYGSHLKQGPARELPPPEPQETFVPTAAAPPAAPNRMQVMQAFGPNAAQLRQALAQPAPTSAPVYQPAPVAAPAPRAPQPAPLAVPPRQLSAADLAIKAIVDKANADLAASRTALDASRLEAGKKTFEAIAKTSSDLHG